MSTMIEVTEDQEKKPLLVSQPSNQDTSAILIQRAITQTFKSTANLANLLPTGTVLTFQVLAPIFTNQGHCLVANKVMVSCLLAVCGFLCFVLSFSDSYRDSTGTVRHGMATSKGMWVIDGSTPLPPEEAAKFKIKLIDFAHAFMSLLIFVAVALLNKNVGPCFFPTPSEETSQVLSVLPVGIGAMGSAFFVAYPTTRHGIGFPVSSR